MDRTVLLEILDHIEDRGEIPLKYAYLEQGAQLWASVSEERILDENFTLGEIHGVKRILSYYLDEDDVEEAYLVDLGPGTGKPGLAVANYLKEKGVEVSYIPVDISQEMLNMSGALLGKEGYDVIPIQRDFEEGPLLDLREFSDRPKIMIFLGNTLGNHSNEQRILSNFRDAMRSEDILLMGLYSYNPLISWGLPEIYGTEANDRFLGHIPFEVLGIDRNAAKIRYFWDNDDKTLISFLEVIKNTAVEVAGRKLRLYKGTRILLGRSVRYTLSRIETVVKETRLRIVGLTESSKNVTVVGASPKRFF